MINAVPQPSAGMPMPPSAPMPTAAPVTPPPTPIESQPTTPETTSSLPPFEPPAAAPMSQKPPKKGMPMKGVIGLLVLILTVVGGAAGFYLTQMNQDVRQQASVGDYTCSAWTVTCADGTSASESSCDVQASFNGSFPGNGQGAWQAEHCASRGGLPGGTAQCGGAAVQCRTYDCPNGMNYNGNECRLGSPTVIQNGTGCPAPASGCGQIDYDSVADGGTDNYCGHTLFTDGCPGGDNPPGGDGEIPGIGHFDTISCTQISGWACDPDATTQKVRVDFWIGINTPGDTGVNRPIGSVTANAPASPGKDATDIAAACGGDSARRFTFTIPEDVKSQTDKKIFAFVIDINKDGSTDDNNPQLTNSPKQIVSCVGPACVSLSMSPAAPKYGEAVNLTCAQVAGATNYSFNVTAGGNVITPTISNNTATFNAIYTGSYQASCSIN